MPINQRLVHLAVPGGTSLCGEGRGGTGSEAGTAAKPSLILLVGVSVPRPNGGGAGSDITKTKESSAPALKEVSLQVVSIVSFKD